jgi:hypothetical protein
MPVAGLVIASILNQCLPHIRRLYSKIARLRVFLENVRVIISCFCIPDEIWKEMQRYLLSAVDFFIVSDWLVDASGYPVSSREYCESFTSYDWPLTKTLELIVNKPGHVVNRKIDVKKFPGPFRGMWLSRVFDQIKAHSGKEYSAKKISQLIQADIDEPFLARSELFVEASQVLAEGKMDVPIPLPNVPIDSF